MKKLVLFLMLMLCWTATTQAVEVAGVMLPGSVEVTGQQLQLNGYGIRKKFFFKIYVGSLYTAQKARTSTQVVDSTGGKLIRMDFLYSEVAKKKIVDGFAEGIKNNTPELSNDPAIKSFLGWFDTDFVEGDRVDLTISADNEVSARHNGRQLGSTQSPALAKAILLIYLGDDPADDNMKDGMLGDI